VSSCVFYALRIQGNVRVSIQWHCTAAGDYRLGNRGIFAVLDEHFRGVENKYKKPGLKGGDSKRPKSIIRKFQCSMIHMKDREKIHFRCWSEHIPTFWYQQNSTATCTQILQILCDSTIVMGDTGEIDTDLEALFITPHGLARREERQLTMRELWVAVECGKREPADRRVKDGARRWKYTFAGVVVITDFHATTIITSWNLSGYGIDIPKACISATMMRKHRLAVQRLEDKSTWTSHTVVVVDQSGSMRTTDADKGITRSDLVWSTLAMSFIADKLKSEERKSTDVFSLVSMRDRGEILLKTQPYDWVLYNNIVELFRTQQPRGAGNYFPALNAAHYLLRFNDYSGCGLMLVFLSDGRPSDQFRKGEDPFPSTHSAHIRSRIGKIASRIGNRLTVGAIPLGEPKEDEFVTLKALMEGAKEYGSHGFFQPPTLSANVLSIAMTTLSSTLTSTVVDMHRRQCRKFRKEPVTNIGGSIMTTKFDRVDMARFATTLFDGSTRYFTTIVRTAWIPGKGWTPFRGAKIFHSNAAIGVAMKKVWFGEGAERLVKEFREVDVNGVFVGPLLVAKDTKFLREQADSAINDPEVESAKAFHKVFCKTQVKADKYAQLFNSKVSALEGSDPLKTPRVEFLTCSIYMIENKSGERHGYLVERMLDIKRFTYRKWNDNTGRVGDTLAGSVSKLTPPSSRAVLDTFFEEDENSEEEESDDDNKGSTHRYGASLNQKSHIFENCSPDACFTEDEIPQAFSCFSYWQSKRKFLVCDLQGIFNTDHHPPIFEMTDPVIHHRDSIKGSTKYGRSDKGLEGIVSFFSTHKCSNLCRLLKSRYQLQVDLPT